MATQSFTITAMPGHLDSALRELAAAEHKPLETIVIETLERGLTLTGEPPDVLDTLAGTWVDDPEFDKAIQAFDAVDEDLWK